jgi:UDP-N-acetylmuramate dehydrogenase
MEIKKVSLREISSLCVGGDGDVVEVTSIAGLIEVLLYAKKENLRTHVIGEGTNTFFGETLTGILFIKMMIRGISVQDMGEDVLITASSGENWDDVVKMCVEKNLWGIENLSYIPGSVGAAPVQNIGAYGTELKDTLVSVEAVTTETLDLVTISNEACQFGYRDSLFKREHNPYIICSVTIKVSRTSCPVLTYKPLDALVGKENLSPEEVRNIVIATRKEKLPDYNVYPNNGSFFKNPVVGKEAGEQLLVTYPNLPLITVGSGYKISSAWLIEHVANMKGERVGNVGTWPKQPLVIVNYGEATGDEVLAFSTSIIEKIREKTGIVLEREVNFVK